MYGPHKVLGQNLLCLVLPDTYIVTADIAPEPAPAPRSTPDTRLRIERDVNVKLLSKRINLIIHIY